MARDLRSSNVVDLEVRASALGSELIPCELNGRDVYLTASQIAALGGSVSFPDPWTVDQTSGEVIAAVDRVAKTPITIQAIAGQVAALLNLKDENGETAALTGGLLPQDIFGFAVVDPSAATPFAKGYMAVGMNPSAGESGGISETTLLLSYGDGSESSTEIWCGPPGGQSGYDILVRDPDVIGHKAELTNSVDALNDRAFFTMVSNSVAGDSRADFGIFGGEAYLFLARRVGQTRSFLDFQDESGNSLVRVLVSGAVGTSAAVPADGDINAGEVFIGFDPTNGASSFEIKGKSLDGTVVVGSLPLA